ncbi:hypothetical protein WJX77_007982 [Trebouxia sp. C0004]
MYKYGQDVEGFPTPTTGSDYTGSTVAKASRVLFAQISDARCSSELQSQQNQGHITIERDASSPLDLAQQNRDCLQPCLSDLTKQDLQELWNFTQAFPCFQNYPPADQLSGCESEVQQQQLSYLAQLLQDKASRGHALQDQVLSTDSQPADRNSTSAGSDSLHGMHGGSHNSTDASADLQALSSQVSQASHHPDITDAHHGFDTADVQQRPHAYSGLGQHTADAACMHHGGQALHTHHQGQGGGRVVGLWAPDAGTHGSGHDCGIQANQSPNGSSHHVLHKLANGAHGFQRQANHRPAYSHTDAHVGPSCLGFGAKLTTQDGMQYCRQVQQQTQLLAPSCNPYTRPQLTHALHDPRHSPQPQHLAKAVHQSPHQGRALQQDRAPQQAMSLYPGQARGQSWGLQQGLQQAWVPQQGMPSQHRTQQGRSAQQGPQQGRVTSSGPQPQRSSQRLGQKRKQALLANKSVPDDVNQGPAAEGTDAADVYSHKSDGLALSGSVVSSTAGLAAKHLQEAAHMTGPFGKCDHVGEAARVAGPAYPQSCSMTPASPLGGPVMTLPEPMIMASNRGRNDSMCISHQSHGRRVSPDCSVGVSAEIDLLADPSDTLGLSPGRQEILDDFDDAQHYVARFQDDLPADPMEGLAVPSWHELLDEAASFPGPSPALTDSPAGKRQKQSKMQESGRQPSWILDLDTKQLSSGVDPDSMLPCVSKAFKLPERIAIPSSQRSMPRTEAQGSDPQTQDRRSPSHSVEAITGGQAAQQAQHETKPAAVQAGKGGRAKRAKRGATGRKAQCKSHTAAAGQRRGQGAGLTIRANGKAMHAQWRIVLPFNTLKDAVHTDSCGSDAQTDTMGGIRGSARASGGGSVQLLKLSGTTSVGVRA